MSDQLLLSAPLNSSLGAATDAVKDTKALTIRTNLVFYKKVLKHNPIDNPLVLRKGTDGKTADGRFDRTGKNKYRTKCKIFKKKKICNLPKAHKGVDLKGDVGDPVYAAADGTLSRIANQKDGYGDYIVIQHKHKIFTLYAHLSEYLVKLDSKKFVAIKAGQIIGKVGKTGNVKGQAHLHFETYTYRNKKKWTEDPSQIYNFQLEPLPENNNNQ